MSELPRDDQPHDSCEIPVDLLNLGMAAGYAPDDVDDGVLAALGAGVGMALRVLAPAADAAVPGERYQLFGEIARGGMGVILQGHDNVMRREVVFKVLREEHQDNPSLRQRFIEEAQVSGRLQHPGVVPVYEIGRFDDRRPYFTMKLVQGRTLAALLAERSNLGWDLPRFLKVFEQISQTIAYAHSRGVIHRDLKPSNIMVGEFGEVQVMDWGLAKVLKPVRYADASEEGSVEESSVDNSQTQAGSVMGTFAYMAPEQARGDVDRLDERCDVFGLGAILCEILTDKPPYAGTHEEVRRNARDANLNDAYERVERSGADVEVRKLALSCLAAEAKARPSQASLVANAMTAYRSAMEERLREAERTSAVAEARAESEGMVRQALEARMGAEQRTRLYRKLALGIVVVAICIGLNIWTKHRKEVRAKTELLVSLAQARSAEGNYAAAVNNLINAIELGNEDATTYIKLGEAIMNSQDETEFRSKKKTHDDFDDIRPNDYLPIAIGEDGKLHTFYASFFKGSARETVKAAVFAFRQATSREPANALAHERLGEALYRQKNYDEAVVSLRHAIELDPNLSMAHANLAYVLFAQDRFFECAEEWRNAVSLNNRIPDYQLQLGYILELLNMDADAAKAFHRAADLLSRDWIRVGDMSNSFRQNLFYDPNRTYALCHLGMVIEKQGNHKEAVDILLQAIKLDPEHAEARYLLGFVFRNQGEGQRASEALREASKLTLNYHSHYPLIVGGMLDSLEKTEEALTVVLRSLESISHADPRRSSYEALAHKLHDRINNMR
jgi:serine/threonine protein kinase/Tfp pilus assembly protein PilF